MDCFEIVTLLVAYQIASLVSKTVTKGGLQTWRQLNPSKVVPNLYNSL
jgi:hypothetical protein